MSLVPETLFRKSIAISNGDELLYSGNSWYEEYRYSSAPNNTAYEVVKKMWFISGDDLDDLDPSTHTSAATGLKYKLFTFGSGIDFCVSVYTMTYGEYVGVVVDGCLKYDGNYIYNVGGLSTAGRIGVGAGVLYNPVGMVKTYGIRFSLYTNYTYGQGKAIEGVTQAQYFGMQAFIPGTSTDNPSGLQSWMHINEDNVYFTSLMDDPDMSDWIYNPQYFWHGYLDNQFSTVGYVLNTNDLTGFYNALKGINPQIQNPFTQVDPDDPTQEQDPSGPGGGDGNQDIGSDPIPFPDLPTGGALSSGAVQAFDVTPAAVTQMFSKLWDTSLFDIANFQKLCESPLDSLVQLQCVPIAPHTNGTGHIKLGNFDTEAVANKIDREYYTIDCGTLIVERYWGSALDFSPYTSAEIWVPMIGFRDLDINDIMGKTIHLKYNYSIFDGNLTAQLMCGNSVLYKWPGNVRETIPVTARVNDALQRIVSGAMGVASAGTGAGMAMAAIGAAVNVAMSKTHVSRTGEMSGSTGLLDDFMPYLIIHRPIQSLAENFRNYKGYPSNIMATLSSLTGYTEVEYIHLTGIDGATDTELEEIETLLKSGVII